MDSPLQTSLSIDRVLERQSVHVAIEPGDDPALSTGTRRDEEWRDVSDVAERGRIQNRIAQRNHRKKLKKRLEDLESKAASTETGESQAHNEYVAQSLVVYC